VTAALELYIGIVSSPSPSPQTSANPSAQICASIPATKPFFSSLLPRIFGTVDPPSSSLPSRYVYPSNSHSRQITQSRSIKITSSQLDAEPELGEELLDLEKTLGSKSSKGMAFSTTTITGAGGHEDSDGEMPQEVPQEEYMRIRQTVDYVSGR